jgi:hypothetical protein
MAENNDDYVVVAANLEDGPTCYNLPPTSTSTTVTSKSYQGTASATEMATITMTTTSTAFLILLFSALMVTSSFWHIERTINDRVEGRLQLFRQEILEQVRPLLDGVAAVTDAGRQPPCSDMVAAHLHNVHDDDTANPSCEGAAAIAAAGLLSYSDHQSRHDDRNGLLSLDFDRANQWIDEILSTINDVRSRIEEKVFHHDIVIPTAKSINDSNNDDGRGKRSGSRSTMYVIVKHIMLHLYRTTIGLVSPLGNRSGVVVVPDWLFSGVGLLAGIAMIYYAVGRIIDFVYGLFGFLKRSWTTTNRPISHDAADHHHHHYDDCNDEDDDDDSEAGDEWAPPLHQQLLHRAQPLSHCTFSEGAAALRTLRPNNLVTAKKRKRRARTIAAATTTAAVGTSTKKRSTKERMEESRRYARECSRLGLLGG